jgi:acyl transferase domain-containing protein
MSVDTACSASLVALHLATGELGRGLAMDAALVAGVHVQCTPVSTQYVWLARMLSPSGRCAVGHSALSWHSCSVANRPRGQQVRIHIAEV